MALLDFLKKPEPAVSQNAAERLVYKHRVEELRNRFAYTQMPQQQREKETFDFLHEFLKKFFAMDARTPMEAISQIQSSTKASEDAKSKAIELYKQYSQFERMKMEAGNPQLNTFLLTCVDIIDTL
ncbi:MAG: hypothetical protein WC408_01330 [Candidatus Micrarchaeia archaeon]|jgi:hypothetical protein